MTTISRQHVDAYRRDGFLLVPRAVGADDLPRLRDRVAELTALSDGEQGVMQHYELTGRGAQIARTERFVDVHDDLRRLIVDGALPAMGEALLGEPVVLYKEKINHKLAGGAGFAPHQDAPAYAFVDHHLTCMIAIDDATVENGCLEVVAGRHDTLLPDDGDGCIDATVADTLDWAPVPMRAGDVLWFGSRVPHRSGTNRSGSTRRAIFCTYNAASEGDLRDRYYADKLRYFAETDAPSSRLSTVGDFQGVAPTAEQLRESGIT